MASWRWRVCLCFLNIPQQCDPASGNWSKWFSSLFTLPSPFILELCLVVHSQNVLYKKRKIFIILFFFIIVGVGGRTLEGNSFLLGRAISSLAFLSISWVLRFTMRPISSISSLSLSSFKVVALTSQDGGSADGLPHFLVVVNAVT